jgi:hypothetical protein
MELKILVQDFASKGKPNRKMEVAVRNGCLKTGLSLTPEMMHPEDLAAMETLNEDTILTELHERLKQGHCHTFVGDVLLVLTHNKQQPIYSEKVGTASLVRAPFTYQCTCLKCRIKEIRQNNSCSHQQLCLQQQSDETT